MRGPRWTPEHPQSVKGNPCHHEHIVGTEGRNLVQRGGPHGKATESEGRLRNRTSVRRAEGLDGWSVRSGARAASYIVVKALRRFRIGFGNRGSCEKLFHRFHVLRLFAKVPVKAFHAPSILR